MSRAAKATQKTKNLWIFLIFVWCSRWQCQSGSLRLRMTLWLFWLQHTATSSNLWLCGLLLLRFRLCHCRWLSYSESWIVYNTSSTSFITAIVIVVLILIL